MNLLPMNKNRVGCSLRQRIPILAHRNRRRNGHFRFDDYP